MPCRSDYMDANSMERNLSQVACILDEVKLGKEINSSHWDGYHPMIYNQTGALNKQERDAMVEELCSLLQKTDVKKLSLEAQKWWRDHQIADKNRIKNELKAIRENKAKQDALDKLTPYEKKLLGL